MPHHVRQLYRLVVVGGERVGKTAIIEQLIFGNHVIGQGGLPTTGDIYEVGLETEKGIVERLQIFDTPGSLFTSTKKNFSEQEHFISIADGVLLVYEITSKASFDLVTSARQKIALRNKDVPMVLLGNKADLNAIREVDGGRAQVWAQSHGIRPYEVTVINRDCLKDPFCYITWRMSNPGKTFSAIPLLTSTPGRLTSTQSAPYMRLPQPDRQDPQTGQSSNSTSTAATAAAVLDSTHHGAAVLKLNESQSEYDFDDAVAQGIPLTSRYPSDAKFPGKHGAATLFFGDCLSSKYKEHHKNH